jgi:hypothetical protein
MCQRGATCRLKRLYVAKPNAMSMAMARIGTADQGAGLALPRLSALQKRELCSEEPGCTLSLRTGLRPGFRHRHSIPTRGTT